MAASHAFYKQMGLPKPLKRALFFFVNSDLDQLAYERVPYDREHAKSLYFRALSVLYAPTPPERLDDDPNNWECVFCEHRETCHAGAEYIVSCRSCRHGQIKDDSWICARSEENPEERAWEACGHWEPNL